MITLSPLWLALLLARGVLGSNATVPTPSSDPAPPAPVCARVSVDAFAALAKAKDTGPPMCSVRANMYSGMNNDAEILSFEEWKALQLQLQNSSSASQPTPTSSAPEPERTESPTAVEGHADANANPAQVTSKVSVPTASPQPTPVPSVLPSLKDRYNFASTDCSARVQGSHKGARSPDAILSHKKDRYMLSPCATKEQHVMVELCDDIRIDTVQLANFEFFSGVFRRFQISVSTDGREWENAGEYEAKNVRGVQSFHPPTDLSHFYRYLRIDFLSHYGNEFYCPVSLLRVYGLTQMEKFKQELAEEQRPHSPSAADHPASVPSAADYTAPIVPVDLPTQASTDPSQFVQQTPHAPLRQPSDVALRPTVDILDLDKCATQSSRPSGTASGRGKASRSQNNNAGTPSDTVTVATSKTITSPPTETTVPTGSATASLSDSSVTTNSPTPSTPTGSVTVGASTAVTASVPVVTQASAKPTLHTPPLAQAGDSIFRTIMNRLASLESNSTLVVSFVEQQARSIRDALRRMEEDVGRITGDAKAHQTLFQRTMEALEKERAALDAERALLMSRVSALADEVVLEKRLGIAQLVLLVAVLMFLAVTRGSTIPLNVPLSRSRTASAVSSFTFPRDSSSFISPRGERPRVASDSRARYGSTSPLRAEGRHNQRSPDSFDGVPFPATGPIKAREQRARRSGSQTPRSGGFASPGQSSTPQRHMHPHHIGPRGRPEKVEPLDYSRRTPNSLASPLVVRPRSPRYHAGEDIFVQTASPLARSRTPTGSVARIKLQRANSQTQSHPLSASASEGPKLPLTGQLSVNSPPTTGSGRLSAGRRAHLHEVRRARAPRRESGTSGSEAPVTSNSSSIAVRSAPPSGLFSPDPTPPPEGASDAESQDAWLTETEAGTDGDEGADPARYADAEEDGFPRRGPAWNLHASSLAQRRKAIAGRKRQVRAHEPESVRAQVAVAPT